VSLKDEVPGWNFIFNQKLIIASGREYGILYTILYVNLEEKNISIEILFAYFFKEVEEK